MKRKTEENKIPGVSYAFTRDGIELPVLDITNPLFTTSIDERKLEEMIRKIAPDAKKRAENFNNIPLFIKRFLSERSYIMAGLMEMTAGREYVTGLSTLMMKLGPGLIGRGSGKLLDRLGSKASGAIMLRMRARDTSIFLADSIKSSLKKFPGKNLCLINIGGGTATDSINALILVSKTDPALLSGIKIELIILDIDDYGPFFASKCIRELVSEGGALNGINIECRHDYYDWKNVSTLENLLSERTGCIPVFSSEGGIFEYGEEGDIIKNLEIISGKVRRQTFLCGSLIKDPVNVDPVFSSTIDMMKIKPKQYGIDGLNRLSGKSDWLIHDFTSVNPRYVVFSLMLNKYQTIQI